MLGFYSLLIWNLWQSYVWQFGYSKVRTSIPFFVGMVEMSVFGQKGYVRATRRRVMTNLAAVQTFDADLKAFELRMRLLEATDVLGGRSRWVQDAAKKYGIDLASHCIRNDVDKAGEDEEDTAKARMLILKGKDHWEHSKHMWPAHAEGNVLTYGWIVIINMFWRQVFSLITIKLSEGGLVVIGAACLMLIHSGNITCLLIFKPYKSRKVSDTETIMLSCLFLVLWCITLQDLLSNHVNVHLFLDTLNKVNNAIDCLAICIFALVIFLPFRQVHEIVSRTISSFRSADTLLNDIYFMTVNRQIRMAEQEKKDLMKEQNEDEMAEAGLMLPEKLAKKMMTVQKALERINTSEFCEPTDEQRKRFRNFVSVVRELPDPPAKKFLKRDSQGNAIGGLDEGATTNGDISPMASPRADNMTAFSGASPRSQFDGASPRSAFTGASPRSAMPEASPRPPQQNQQLGALAAAAAKAQKK